MNAWVCIPLCGKQGEGDFALVDAGDALLVRGHRWFSTGSHAFAAVAQNGRKTRIYMHRLIMGARTRRQLVDHISGDGMDNRRANLRFATPSQNTANCRMGSHLDNRYRGVTRSSDTRWLARCQHGTVVRLGEARTEFQAARMYDRFARELFGDFARLNFPRKGEKAAAEPIYAAERRRGAHA